MMPAMKPALDTLFLPLTSGQLDLAAGARVVFLNAMMHHFLQKMVAPDCIQPFKPYALPLDNAGLKADPDNHQGDFSTGLGTHDAALVMGTKNRMETEIYLGRALLALRNGGILVCAADNKEGAGRLKKMFQDLGLNNMAELSKNKARVCWAARPDDFDDTRAKNWAAQDRIQDIGHGFVSRPGLYGWDKFDKGSALLAAHVPRDLKGHGADFGCGYGYLARAVLQDCRKVKSIDFIDADARALEICALNLAGLKVKSNALWLDLTAPQPDLQGRYDWIVMNPPFHEGQSAKSDIGIAFIKNAHAALHRGGVLYMVANNQLPYERVLSELFYKTELIAQGGGFKVFRAVK